MSRHRRVALGASPVTVVPLGVGTWAWGDRPYWGYDGEYGARDLVDAFAASVDAGLDLFDTAETYADGESEKILGWMAREHGGSLCIATKFAPLARHGFTRALASSAKRLKRDVIDLYQIHWCDTSVASIDSLMGALADAVAAGSVRAVGVSNFTAREMRDAHAALARRGVPLASNQVHYSVMHRAPERDGVLDACRELGVTLIAYSPLEQGMLAGKYAEGAPTGPRGEHARFAETNRQRVADVVRVLRAGGEAHGGRAPEEVAINWLLAQGVVVIAGAKTGKHAESNARAMEWEMTEEDCKRVGAVARG